MVPIHRVLGRMSLSWHAPALAVVETWTDLGIPLDEYEHVVMRKGIYFVESFKAQAWIVDAAAAEGSFRAEVLEFLEHKAFPALREAGVQYLVSVPPGSALGRVVMGRYAAHAAAHGLETFAADSLPNAVFRLAEHRSARSRSTSGTHPMASGTHMTEAQRPTLPASPRSREVAQSGRTGPLAPEESSDPKDARRSKR